MAKLHRRVQRFSHRVVTVLCGVASLVALSSHGNAQELPAFESGPSRPAPAPMHAEEGADLRPSVPAPTTPAIARAEESTGRTSAEFDALLGGLTDGSPDARMRAAEAVIASVERDDLPAIRERLLAPLRGIPIDTLRLKLVRVVTNATQSRPNAEYDLLALLIALPRSRDTDVAIERITLARAVGRVPTADAGRVLLAFAASFNGTFRQEVGRIVRATLRDNILPAIIEARNPSEMQRIFIRQLRESLRRVTPGETVQQRDNALLAEILRAYGTMRQADAMKVVISFVNSDRAQVRDAARWAVAQYGVNAVHALRDAYEMYEGRDPNPSWGWERVARELYQANDRRRDAEVAQRLDQGLAAGRAHNVDVMLGHFRFVLARHPSFERRREMVPLLIENARRLESSDAARAETLWRLALWVDPDGAQARAIRGEVLFLEAERALSRGVAEPELYRAVLRVDPQNERAAEQLENVEQSRVLNARRRRRLMGALGLAALAAATLWAIVRRLPAQRPSEKHHRDGTRRAKVGDATASSKPTKPRRTRTAKPGTAARSSKPATKPASEASTPPSRADDTKPDGEPHPRHDLSASA